MLAAGVIIGGSALIGGFLLRRRNQKKKKAKIFGKPLDDFSLKKLADTGVPKHVEAWIRRLETDGVFTEGIFTRQIEEESLHDLYTRVDTGQIKEYNYDRESIFELAALVHLFLRELPDCVIKNYSEFIEIERKNPTLEEWKQQAQSALEKLPNRNVLLLGRLFILLGAFANNPQARMSHHDLSQSFCPSLIFSIDPEEAEKLNYNCAALFSTTRKLLENYESLNFSRPKTIEKDKKKKK